MAIIKRMLLAVVGLVALLAIISLFLPPRWELKEQAIVKAPPAAVFPYVNNLKHWPEWVVWHERDPGMTTKYRGARAGTGAVGELHAQDGRGEIRILKSEPDRLVAYELLFRQGRGRMHGEIVLTPGDEGTAVDWTWRGEAGHNPAAKYIALMLRPLIADDQRQSLDKLKAKVEQQEQAHVGDKARAPGDVGQ